MKKTICLIMTAVAGLTGIHAVASPNTVFSAKIGPNTNATGGQRFLIQNPVSRDSCLSSIQDPASLMRDHLRQARRMERPSGPRELSEAAGSGERTYSVTCVFPGESEPWFAIYAPGFFKETRYDDWEEEEEGKEGEATDRFVFQVPAGTYDIATSFYGELKGLRGFGYVVRENVEIKGDMTLTFSREEATEVQRIRPVLRNGEEMRLPKARLIDHEPWLELDDSEANATFIYYDYYAFREGCEDFTNGYQLGEWWMDDYPSDLYFFINPLSDSYHTLVNTFLATKEGEYLVSTSDIRGFSDRTVNTYNEGYEKMPVARFAETPLYDKEAPQRYRMALTGAYWIDNVQQGGGGLFIRTTDPDVYVTTQPCDAVDVKTVVWQVSVQAEEYLEETESMLTAEMAALPVWCNDGKWEYVNQNHSRCGNFSYQCPLEGPIVEYPGLEPYCFTSDQITEPFGNSSPVLVLMTQIYEDEDPRVIRFSPQAWIGRYGEVRNCDRWLATSKVWDGEGKLLFSDEDDEDASLRAWCFDYFASPHEAGPLKAEFYDPNVLVDGEIPGFNRTFMEIDETREDVCAPTPQMLIFKNTDGIITDRFDDASRGMVEFSAGDFNWLDTESFWGYTVEEADVELEYSPYGADLWMPVEVEEIPEYFYMPGFGYFYRGSLSSVTEPSSNGWYDIRLTLTDKAGNRTQEHISPAFKIEIGGGMPETPDEEIKVWIDDDGIHTNMPNARLEVFAIDGTKLGMACQPDIRIEGYEGTVIVKASDPCGKTGLRKLMLRHR